MRQWVASLSDRPRRAVRFAVYLAQDPVSTRLSEARERGNRIPGRRSENLTCRESEVMPQAAQEGAGEDGDSAKCRVGSPPQDDIRQDLDLCLSCLWSRFSI